MKSPRNKGGVALPRAECGLFKIIYDTRAYEPRSVRGFRARRALVTKI